MDRVVQKRNQDIVQNILDDIELSDQFRMVPQQLATMPSAIFFIGTLRLLAYSNVALTCTLDESESFKYLKKSDLSSGLIQLVQIASKAFYRSKINMANIQTDLKSLFGASSPAHDIMDCLADRNKARKSLTKSTKRLEDGMKECCDEANAMVTMFEEFISCAEELEYSITGATAAAAQKQQRAKEEKERQEQEKTNQREILAALAAWEKKNEAAYDTARKEYKEAGKNLEAKAIGLKFLSDLSGISELVHATVGVVRDAPKMISHVSGIFGGNRQNWDATPKASTPSISTVVPIATPTPTATTGSLDPALLYADSLQTVILELCNVLSSNANENTQRELRSYKIRLEAILGNLGNTSSGLATDAKSIISAALSIIQSIPNKKNPTTEQLMVFKSQAQPLPAQTARLCAIAVAQPSSGYGSNFENSFENLSLGHMDSAAFLKLRHQRLMMARETMLRDRDQMRATGEKMQAYNERIIRLTQSIASFDAENAKQEQVKEILRDCIDQVAPLIQRMQEVSEFFHKIDRSLSKGLHKTIANFLSHLDDHDDFGRAAREANARAISMDVVTIRAHALFVSGLAKTYEQIVSKHVSGCMSMAATMPVKATSVEQLAAKDKLASYTQQCAADIRGIATSDLDIYEKKFSKRIVQYSEQMQLLPPIEENIRIAIVEQVEESKSQMAAKDDSGGWSVPAVSFDDGRF